MRRKAYAFTLVELLVVIGIIAVLISVLLPSLNKARAAANLVDCQARLQQMGQALQIYTAQNKGLLPWGGVNNVAQWTDNALPNTSNQEQFWWWMFTLSEIMNKNIMGSDGFVRNLSPVFRDRDTIDPTLEVRWVNHYTVNPRLLYRADVPDPSPAFFSPGIGQEILPPQLVQRKITSVRRPSNVFVIWDGPQLLDQGANAYGIAEALDAWGWYNNSGLCYDTPTAGFVVARPLHPGRIGNGFSSGKATQKKYNFDAPEAFLPNGWLSHIRFRHQNNSRLAALCLDGHVEVREVGTVMVRDIFTNFR